MGSGAGETMRGGSGDMLALSPRPPDDPPPRDRQQRTARPVRGLRRRLLQDPPGIEAPGSVPARLRIRPPRSPGRPHSRDWLLAEHIGVPWMDGVAPPDEERYRVLRYPRPATVAERAAGGAAAPRRLRGLRLPGADGLPPAVSRAAAHVQVARARPPTATARGVGPARGGARVAAPSGPRRGGARLLGR